MLYIVGYWHLFTYTDAFPQYKNSFTLEFFQIVLGLFVIISGFLIGCSTTKSASLIHFYKNRLIRIYPLYVLAVILFYIYGLNDVLTSIKSLIFLSMYIRPAPLTLWFITMLMLFYIATPFIVKLVEYPVKYFLLVILIFMITIALNTTFRTVDYRILLYFPCYCIGLHCAQNGLKTRFVNIYTALLLFGLWLIFSFIEINSWTLNKLKDTLIILSCSYLFFTICYLNEHKFRRFKIISFLSYCSYSMYLFHRPIYITLKALYFPIGAQFQILYLMTAGLVTVALISWGLQKLYDIGYTAVSEYVRHR